MLSLEEIKDYFLMVNSHAKKELGQNFLLDQKVVDIIVDALALKETDSLLEIGPGLGSLTESLLNKTSKYVAVEYDEKFVKHLNISYENSNLTVIKNNILKFKDFEFNKICGNLPYYISTDILEFVIDNFLNLEKAVFMVQKEFFDRIVTKDKSNKRPLNYLLEYAYNVNKILDVGKNSFFPIPKVDSIVFKIERKEFDVNLFKSLKKVLTESFKNRRKTIYNNLKSLINNEDLLIDILSKSKIDPKTRAEDLLLNDFIELTKIMLKVSNKKI